MAKVVERSPLEPFRISIDSLLTKAQALLSSIQPCAAGVDTIYQLLDRRDQVQSVMSRVNPNTGPEEFARHKKEFDRLTEEIGELWDPFPAVQEARSRFVQELKTAIHATPVSPAILREIRKEMDRLPLLRDAYQVGMKQSEADLATLQQRLREMLTHLPGGSQQHVARFPTPQGAGWADVQIEFLSDHRIAVNVREQSAVLNFAEAGFEDRRTKNPNSIWTLLREIAQRDGRLERPRGKDLQKVEKGVQAIRKTLQELFGIQDDPFHPYQDVKCYQTKCKICFPRPDVR